MRLYSEGFGPRGFRVRVFERERGGILYWRHRDPAAPKGVERYIKGSLGHRDKQRARTWALRRSDQLRADGVSPDPVAHVARVFALYLAYATPKKVDSSQSNDRRAAEMWTRILGARRDLHAIDSGSWERFARDRASGAIDANGERVRAKDRVPVRPRTVRSDLQWLRTAIRWAIGWRDESGRPLMRDDPTRFLKLPEMDDQVRPIVSQDRHEKLLEAAKKVELQVRRPRWRRKVKSFLPELLELENETGRRISAVRQLHVRDVQLKRSKLLPHGAILWPAETDKKRKRRTQPMNGRCRAAVERRLAALPVKDPAACLFPSPTDPATPASKRFCTKLLHDAERIAELEHVDGLAFHGYRRKWSTERKHLPLKEVAAAGGWEDETVVLSIYQQVDEETMYQVVANPRELREVNDG